MFFVYLIIFMLGASIGSFANVLIYRIPQGIKFVSDRSRCPHCNKILKWRDLIPFLSFLFLRRRCRYCAKSISWSYFGVELYSGIILVASFLIFGSGDLPLTVFTFFLAEIFLILFMTDLKYLILPDQIIFTGIVGAIIYGFFEKISPAVAGWGVLSLNHFLAGIILALFFFGIWFISHGVWLGFGDVKLGLLIGLVFGPLASVVVIYMAVLAGTLIGIILLIFKRANLKTKLPLGSFITLSGSLYLFFSRAIIEKVAFLDVISRILK